MPDLMTTNICFGGPDLKTAFVTLSWTGRLVTVDWPVAGLNLNWSDR
jgi:gluconolactonase